LLQPESVAVVSYPNLNLLLHAANRRELFLGLSRVGSLGLGVVLLGMLIALAVDALFALPVMGLLMLDAALLTVVLLILGKLLRVVRQSRFDPRRLARLLERQLGMTSNALINAIDLKERQASLASRRLADLAVEQGEHVARQVDLPRAMVSGAARRGARWVVWTFAATLLAYLLMPGVFARGLPRLVDPTGNHPPFTLVKFDVEAQPDPLYYGASAVVTARLSGPVVPDRADLVFDDGDRQQRLPMIETDDGYRLDLQRVEQTRSYYIDTPEGRSDWYQLTVQQVPLIEDLWVTYRYPGHTGWPPRRYRLTNHKIEAMTGTEVTLEAASNFPLSFARVEFFGDDASQPRGDLQLTPDAPPRRFVRGAFRLTQSGRLTLRLVGTNQQLGPELREIPLLAVDDQPPQVILVDPEPLALAVEGWTVPLSVEATDDVKVVALQVNYQLDARPSQCVSLSTPSTDARQMRGQGELDLAQLEAKAGDRIRLFATAADNRPGGGQMGDSESHTIQVISHEQYLDYLRRAYQMQQMSEEIAQLRERLDELVEQRRQILDRAESLQQMLSNGQPLDPHPTQPQPQQQLERGLELYSQQLTELSEQLDERLEMPELYDAEHAYREQLEALDEQLERQQQHAKGYQQALQDVAQTRTPDAEDLQRLQLAQQQLQQSAEWRDDLSATSLAESQRQIERLTQAQRMLSEHERIQHAVRQQRQLVDRLQSLEQQHPAPSDAEQRRADQLAWQQERLNQQLQEAQSALRRTAEEANESLPRTSADARQLCDSIDQAGIPSDQQQAARSARQGALPRARQLAQQAAEKLEALADQGPSAQGVGREWSPDDLDRGLRLSPEGVQRTLQQLAQSQAEPPMGRSSMGGQPEAEGRSPGATSRVGLHGPQPPRDAFSTRRGRQPNQALRRGAASLAEEPAGAAEVIDAASRSAKLGSAGNVRGVPVGYRDQAEAYFRRLAEESSREPTSPNQ
jgi:hypothetical protein